LIYNSVVSKAVSVFREFCRKFSFLLSHTPK